MNQKNSIPRHLFRLFKNPSDNLASLIYLGDRLSESKKARTAAEKLMKDPAIQMRYSNLDGFVSIDLVALGEMPDGSFGKALATFFSENGLTAYPVPNAETPSPHVYLRERRRIIHDYLHLVLGFDTDLDGEARVNAFVHEQTGMPISKLIIAGIAAKTAIKNPKKVKKLRLHIASARAQARKSHNLFAFQWERFYLRPLEDVVEEFTRRWRLEKVISEQLIRHQHRIAIGG